MNSSVAISLLLVFDVTLTIAHKKKKRETHLRLLHKFLYVSERAIRRYACMCV